MAHQQTFEQLCAFVRETAVLDSVESLLGWDERTLMPPAAGPYRAEQMTLLAGMIHRRRTDPRLGGWLDELQDSPLAADPHSDAGTTLRQLRRDYDKRVKLPQSLVEELTRAAVLGQQAWVTARKQNDFPSFAPHLKKIVHLKQQEAEALGYERCRYDALLDEFEPDARTADVAAVLGALRADLVPLVQAIGAAGRALPVEILSRSYPVVAQEAFGRMAAAKVGFDFQRGRLDVTHHPFCSGMGPHDCRITTRYDEHFFPCAFFGILHEAGHGMYDQGLRTDWFGLPPGTFVSLGIHESQSRMWENFVGRSAAFWEHFFEPARQAFPAALGDVRREDFVAAINDVRPSLIRVEADEATYNLHIIIRFELEQALIDGSLAVDDLPTAWQDKYREYLGLTPPNDSDGVLQDIHWSSAAIGYFSTYSLGNLYAAQFFETADRELGGLARTFAAGDFRPLLDWLQQKIHRPGQCYRAAELAERITGRPLSHQPLIRHLRQKLAPLYGLA